MQIDPAQLLALHLAVLMCAGTSPTRLRASLEGVLSARLWEGTPLPDGSHPSLPLHRPPFNAGACEPA